MGLERHATVLRQRSRQALLDVSVWGIAFATCMNCLPFRLA
jgi:hypothetical protein